MQDVRDYCVCRTKAAAVLVPAMLLALSPVRAQSAGGGWRAYINPRFGVAVEYPGVFVVRDRPPDNSDEQGFRTASGDATLRVFGSYNIDGLSAAQLMQSYRQANTAYSYAKATKGWFVLSGTRDSQISYMRCTLGTSDVIGCFELEYPAAGSVQWSLVVTRMSGSLRVSPVR